TTTIACSLVVSLVSAWPGYLPFVQIFWAFLWMIAEPTRVIRSLTTRQRAFLCATHHSLFRIPISFWRSYWLAFHYLPPVHNRRYGAGRWRNRILQGGDISGQ